MWNEWFPCCSGKGFPVLSVFFSIFGPPGFTHSSSLSTIAGFSAKSPFSIFLMIKTMIDLELLYFFFFKFYFEVIWFGHWAGHAFVCSRHTYFLLLLYVYTHFPFLNRQHSIPMVLITS